MVESPLRYRRGSVTYCDFGNVLQLLSRKRKRAVFSDFSHRLLVIDFIRLLETNPGNAWFPQHWPQNCFL